MGQQLTRIGAGFAAMLAALAVLASVTPSTAQILPVEEFARRPALAHVSLSPSGRYLAYVAQDDSTANLAVRDLVTGETSALFGSQARERFGGVYIEWVEWKGDDLLIMGATRLEVTRYRGEADGAIRTANYGRSLLAIPRDGGDIRRLAGPLARAGRPGDLLDILPDQPGHILITHMDASGDLNVARVDVRSGESELVIEGDPRVISYLTDQQGDVVGRLVYRGIRGRVLVMQARDADGGWTETFRLHRDEIRDFPRFRFLGPTDQPSQVYVAVRPEEGALEDTYGVHVFDFATRTMGPAIWRHGTYDVANIVLNSDGSGLAAGCYWADVYRCDFIDPDQERVMAGIRRFFGAGFSASVVSQSEAGDKWLIWASSPSNAGQYYLFDLTALKMELVGSLFPGLPEARLGQMRRIDYAATDGLALTAYLTQPPGTNDGDRPPLIVMPHGGPETSDHLKWDTWAQFFASRGYQVLQPNFRGSSGQGRNFAEAGYRQWGGLMQDDVTAAVQHLIDQGLADPDRICIVGASYGGYAALMGPATRPDLYRCTIAIAGPSDLVDLMNWERREAGDDTDRYEYWVRSIGDPREDRTALEAVSPVRLVEGWTAPVLLIHGERDDVVPVAQSRDMDRVLRRAGADVELLILEEAGHADWERREEIAVMQAMEAFLAEHLPVAP